MCAEYRSVLDYVELTSVPPPTAAMMALCKIHTNKNRVLEMEEEGGR